jgi:N-ethylmaleimide reductase
VTDQGLQDFVTPRALTLGEIPGIIEQYRVAARNARAAGFDGVEVHGANGYLLDQFLRDGSNRRDDAYGGPIAKRARLLLEVTEAVAEVWGANRVGVRISPVNRYNSMADSDPDATFGYLAQALGRFGLAYLHVVERDASGREPAPRYDRRRLRAAFDGPYIANGGYDRLRGDWALASGAADLIAFGKAFLANPDLPERFRRNAPLNAPDPASFYGGDGRGYTDYPALEAASTMA